MSGSDVRVVQMYEWYRCMSGSDV